MRLSTILSTLGAPGGEKTAAAAPAAGTPASAATPASDRLKQALNDAVAAPPAGDKTAAASAASPVADMTKIAADLAAAEHDALVKEGQLYGAAVADGMIARLGQYGVAADKLAAAQPAPGAASAPIPGDDFGKFAAENPDLIKDAAELGFATTTAQLEKLGEAAYVKGYNDMVESIYKVGHHCFVTGFKEALALAGGSR